MQKATDFWRNKIKENACHVYLEPIDTSIMQIKVIWAFLYCSVLWKVVWTQWTYGQWKVCIKNQCGPWAVARHHRLAWPSPWGKGGCPELAVLWRCWRDNSTTRQFEMAVSTCHTFCTSDSSLLTTVQSDVKNDMLESEALYHGFIDMNDGTNVCSL